MTDMGQAESETERATVKKRVSRLSRMEQEALVAVLDRYAAGESLEELRCSAELGELISALGRTGLVAVDVVKRQKEVWTVDVTVTISDELVGEVRALL